MRNRRQRGVLRRMAGAGLALWLATACASNGSELRELVLPDQFHLSYATGRGDIDNKADSTRGFNEEDSALVVGMSWNLSRPRPSSEAVSRDDLRQLFLALREDLRPPPAVEREPEPEPAPAPAPPEPEPEPVAEIAPPPPEPVLLMLEPEVLAAPAPALETPPAPEPVQTSAALPPLESSVHVPEDWWPWLPIAALGLGLMLAFAVYTSPGRHIVRDGRALASRAR